MKSILVVLIIVLFQFNHEYNFDYRLEYELKVLNSDSIRYANYYVNSKNNSYYADIRKSKKVDEYKFYFRDEDKLTISTTANGDYKNPGTVIIPDSITQPWHNEKPNVIAKDYTIERLKDTIIKNKRHARVMFKMTHSKKAKRKKAGSMVYIIDTNKVMKPFIAHPTNLHIWRQNRNMPNGLIIEKLSYKYDGTLSKVEKLIQIKSVNFHLKIQ